MSLRLMDEGGCYIYKDKRQALSNENQLRQEVLSSINENLVQIIMS